MTFIRFIPILLITLLPALGQCADVTLVVHKDNPVASLGLAEARNILLGKKVFWSNGQAIDVLMQKTDDAHRDFVLMVLGKSPRQLRMYWKRVLFSGEGVPPLELSDDRAVRDLVAINPKAIGFIDIRYLDDRVKPIKIDME